MATGIPVEANSSSIYYSDDAINWNPAYDVNGDVPFGIDFDAFGGGTGGYAIAYNGTSWVAVGIKTAGASSNIYYSDNAVSWTPAYDINGNVPFGTFGDGGAAIAYNGTSWVAVGGKSAGASSNIYYSDNAVSWTPAYDINGNVPFDDAGDGTAIAYNGTSWVAVGDGDTSTIYYSDNAVSWTPAYDINDNVPFGFDGGAAIAYNGTSWVAVGDGDAGVSSTIYYSDNAVSWTPAYDINDNVPFSTDGGYAVIHTGSYWIAGGGLVDNNGSVLYYSTNGISWTPASYRNDVPQSEDYFEAIKGLCFADNKVVAVGGYETR